MSFNSLIRVFRRQRIARACVGLLVLAGAAFGQYKLAHLPRAVNLDTTGKFSPATIKLGQQELIIEGPVVNAAEGMLFSHDGRPNELVAVGLEHARLDEQTIRSLEGTGLRPPSAPAEIDYRARDSMRSFKGESCRTRVEVRAMSKMPSEIHIFQLGVPGLSQYRYLEMTAKGAELVSRILTESPGDSELAPGCQKLLMVGDWTQPLTNFEVKTIVDDNSALRFTFSPLARGSSLWGGPEGLFEPFDLGVEQQTPNDPQPFQARAVSIRSLRGGDPAAAPLTLASAQSDGALLTIHGLRIGSDQIQLNIAGKGYVKINGEDVTIDVLKRVGENPIPSALLAAGNAALLAWVASLILKSPSTGNAQGRTRRFQRRRRGNANNPS